MATEPWIGVFIRALDVPNAYRRVADLFVDFLDAKAAEINRVTISSDGAKTRAFKRKGIHALFEAPETRQVTFWRERGPQLAEASAYLRPIDPAEQRFQNKYVDLLWRADALGLDDDARACLEGLVRHYPIAQGSIGRYRSQAYASREAFGSVGRRRDIDEATLARLHDDGMRRAESDTKLRRLYPITIIGPDIWATLPPIPAGLGATVEELGPCKLLTAWPTLCEPRDPDFLRGTRALREWLWPYTIQNPADHVDHDPA